LIYGCCENDKECTLYLVDVLLKHNVSAINKVAFNGKTPLRKAAFIGHKNVVEGLLTLPTEDRNIDAEDFVFRRWALHAAAYRGHLGIVEMLISAGSDVIRTGVHRWWDVTKAAWQAVLRGPEKGQVSMLEGQCQHLLGMNGFVASVIFVPNGNQTPDRSLPSGPYLSSSILPD
jgi:ankyrin repeat protein